MKKIEHIGIAVKNMEFSKQLFSNLLDCEPYKEEMVDSEAVKTSFYQVGESKIELLEATSPESAIHRFIEKRGEGFHHIAFSVDDIEAEISRMIDLGFQPLMDRPKKGADNKLVFFFHPKSTNGLLIELCQEMV